MPLILTSVSHFSELEASFALFKSSPDLCNPIIHHVFESTTTDWVADQEYAQYADGSVPGIIQLKCTTTRSNTHYNVTCSTTRNGSHLGHAPSPFPEAPADSVLTINGTPVEEGTKSHAIISHALKMVDFVY